MEKIIKMFVVATVVFGLSLWIGINASAESTNPCADDIQKFCKDVQPGGRCIVSCLQAHQTDLTPACKERMMIVRKSPLIDFEGLLFYYYNIKI